MVHIIQYNIRSKVESLEGFKIVVFRIFFCLLVWEKNLFQLPFFYGYFQIFQENALILDIFEVDLSEYWLFCADDHSHIHCAYDDCRYLLTVLTHPRLVKVRYY